MINDNEEKTYFIPGNRVVVKHKLDYKPIMIVDSVDKFSTHGNKPQLLGVTCYWFSNDLKYQSKRFNTKDLEHAEI